MDRRFHPLLNTNPEFVVIDSEVSREFRVENRHLARDGSGRTIRRTHGWSWREVFLASLVAYFWPKICYSYITLGGLITATVLYIRFKCTQVLHESVVVFPPHGIQFETHRGFPPHPLMASRRFIPMSDLQDFLINEGLRRWDIRFYLAALSKSKDGHFFLDVAFENILPRFPILLEVYRGVHDVLFHDLESIDEEDI